MSKKVMNSLKIKNMVLIALMTAIICVIAPFAIIIPISPVPISLATFVIYLTIIILGWKDGVISVVLYVLLGFAGAPVFTGFTGGAAKILGPTGGYIIGYIFLAFIEGAFVDGARKIRPYEEGSASIRPYEEGSASIRPYEEGFASVRPYESVGASHTSAPILLGMVLGTIVLYIFGTIWLMRQAGLTLVVAFSAGVLPFIVGDIVKMFVALFVGTRIRKVLIKSGLV